MQRLFLNICLPILLTLLTGCTHLQKTCSFRLDFIDDIPFDIKDYTLVEVDSHELVKGAPWGFELYSDALTNAHSMVFVTKDSLGNYRRFLESLTCLEEKDLRYEMETVRLSAEARIPELSAVAFLQKKASVGFPDGHSVNEMLALSRNLASWIMASRNFEKNEYSLMPMRDSLSLVYADGGLCRHPRCYSDAETNEINCRLQKLAYACILSERFPDVKRLYINEFSKIKSRTIQHGRWPLPVDVDVVDERRFLFKDQNHRPFAELTMHFNYGYFARAFQEVKVDSKMVMDMTFRALLHRYNKGVCITGSIHHNLKTGSIKVSVKGL